MYSVSCNDMGNSTCDFVAEGDTKEMAAQALMAHAVAAHGVTNDDATMQAMVEKAHE